MRAGAIAIAALLVVAGCSGEITGGGEEPGGGGDDEPHGGVVPDGGGPAPVDCYGRLDAAGVTYERGPDMPGVASPVTVTTPIAGITHRYLDASEPRATFFMDCELAAALVAAAPLLAERDVVEVVDIGVYNYRCIGSQGTPPDCPNGISQHAYALAIDFAEFVQEDGTTYSVQGDWVIDPDGEDTCGAATASDEDAFLHELICAEKAAGIWNIVLTPNYNADHRDHFHVDLTADSDFIERTAAGRPAATAMDVAGAYD